MTQIRNWSSCSHFKVEVIVSYFQYKKYLDHFDGTVLLHLKLIILNRCYNNLNDDHFVRFGDNYF